MNLFGWLREINGKQSQRGGQGGRDSPARPGATTQLLLECLEDRLAPTNFSTTTNVAISITPNFLARSGTATSGVGLATHDD